MDDEALTQWICIGTEVHNGLVFCDVGSDANELMTQLLDWLPSYFSDAAALEQAQSQLMAIRDGSSPDAERTGAFASAYERCLDGYVQLHMETSEQFCEAEGDGQADSLLYAFRTGFMEEDDSTYEPRPIQPDEAEEFLFFVVEHHNQA